MGNLPSQITTFVGRRQEISEVRAALRGHRLVSLVGPGGVGKTRLALEAAAQTQRSYPGGLWFIDLGKHPEGRSVVDHVAATLRLGREQGEWQPSDLAAAIEGRPTLLIFDNCEHVLDDVAELVGSLLALAADLHVLATSRQALGLAGERLVHLEGLAYPEATVAAPSELAAIESVMLFVDRAASIIPGFELSADNCDAVADIARRVEGLPLAIELAAARARVLSPHQIAGRLENQFRLLGVTRGVEERHHTLRATIEWSFNLCSQAERLCWARLAVFPADFDLDAAEDVAAGGAIDRESVIELVTALIDKSILRSVSRPRRPTRYRFTEPLRDFGREKLEELEPLGVSRTRHLEHFGRMAMVVPEVLFGPRQVERIDDLTVERANLEAALLQAVAENDMDAADLLACAVALVAFAGGSVAAAASALATASSQPGNRSTARVQLLWLSAWVAINQGALDRARTAAADCRRLAQLIDDRLGMVHALQYLGQCELLLGDSTTADRHCRRALGLARDLGEDHLVATVLVRFAQVVASVGDESAALDALEESISVSDRVGEVWCRGFAAWNLAVLLQGMGRAEEALRRARGALTSRRIFDDVVGLAQGLEVMAWCQADLGSLEHAAVLCGAADTIWGSTGAVLPPALRGRRDECERQVARGLGAERFAVLRLEGRSLDAATAVSWARAGSGEDRDPDRHVEGVDVDHRREASVARSPLTRRENEVAELVGQGLKNTEIADRLVISRRTAEAHVQHILEKLGFTSRAQISAWAAYQQRNDR